jgi:hypothetical protein
VNSLVSYYDPAYSSGSKDQLLKEDRAELQILVALCAHALAMPRRLGVDATSDELARDKKIAKRLAHCFRKSLEGWHGVEVAIDEPDIRQRAAVVKWGDLAAGRRAYLLARFAPYATLAIDAGQEPWGNHILTLLQNELGWIDYALR